MLYLRAGNVWVGGWVEGKLARFVWRWLLGYTNYKVMYIHLGVHGLTRPQDSLKTTTLFISLCENEKIITILNQ